MAKQSRPDGIFEFAVASSAWNYVAKWRTGVLRAKGLKSLGHIFDFATLCRAFLAWRHGDTSCKREET